MSNGDDQLYEMAVHLVDALRRLDNALEWLAPVGTDPIRIAMRVRLQRAEVEIATVLEACTAEVKSAVDLSCEGWLTGGRYREVVSRIIPRRS